MTEKIDELRQILAEVADLHYISNALGWDQQTYMPQGGAVQRGNELALLGRLEHDRIASQKMGDLLQDLKPYASGLDPDSIQARMIKMAARKHDKALRVPSEHVVEFARITTLAQQAWAEARQKSDFSMFKPHLEKIVALRKEYASFFPGFAHPYDALLDDFEPGMKTAEVKAIFDELRPKQADLIRKITARPQVEDNFLHQAFDERHQREFAEKVITDFGYDWNRGRQDISAHPFTQELGLGDVRITTRVDPMFLNPLLFATMHECGHALYAQGLGSELDRTGLDLELSLAVHESQSRLWENLVGRSLAFWEYYYPRLRKVFPQLGLIPLKRFYKGINKVYPSFIRVYADEATYNLHIMLRLEIEIALVEGTAAVDDLPAIWNERMEEYLGVTPPDDARGLLQDVHWSSGILGYFSTYALGNLVSAQLWEKVNQEIPDLAGQIRNGNFTNLLAWLREKIHRPGGRFEPQELVEHVTGSRINSGPYMRYLNEKFGEIYNL